MKHCKRYILFLFAWTLLLNACGTQTPQATPQLLKVYVTSAASARLTDLYNCSTPSTAILLSDPQSADLTLRLGPPDGLSSPAFQIGSDEVEVIVQAKNNVGNLTVDQIHSIFLGQVANWKDVGGADMPIQVWTYSPNEDIQQIFERNVMDDQQVTSSARLAVSAQNMLDSIARAADAVGFLPRGLETSSVHDVYRIASAPILAITNSEPQGALNELIACLQK
ncbi:MAG TPA: substrate-binding domain-containing protein [Anaerolineales bacterium]|nr:substrate-binding domain-containing protein [Anaerolineales bacterium]